MDPNMTFVTNWYLKWRLCWKLHNYPFWLDIIEIDKVYQNMGKYEIHKKRYIDSKLSNFMNEFYCVESYYILLSRKFVLNVVCMRIFDTISVEMEIYTLHSHISICKLSYYQPWMCASIIIPVLSCKSYKRKSRDVSYYTYTFKPICC